MEIRDFVVNRSFSGNGLWQWDEKQGLARHAISPRSEQYWGRFEGRLNEEQISANECWVKL